MRRWFGTRFVALRAQLRALLIGPQLAAFLPAIMLGAYWFGGEGVLLTVAVIFPALMAFLGLLTRPAEAGGMSPETDLVDRGHLTRRIDDHIRTSQSSRRDTCVCLAIGIDDATRLEDHYGPSGFDTITQNITARLRQTLRDTDMIADLGRGRFAVCLTNTTRIDLETVVHLAGRLQSAVSTPITLGNAKVFVSISVGFALPSRVPNLTGDGCLAAAEGALDDAQQNGPSTLRAFAPGMKPRPRATDASTQEVMQALDSGQIVPWFQPQVSTDTGQVTGFEALARWNHPQRGLIAPGAFLPVIGKCGLFDRLGEVVLYECLSALRAWEKGGFDVPTVSVNLSSEELQNPKLFDKIRWELDRFDIAPDRLILEILENVIERTENDVAMRNISALSRLGCGIDLDDFGTGHASIANIRRFDVNRIKIDRSYVTHVDTDPDQQNYVGVMLTMADRLGLDVLAEGVESHGEHAMLAQLGCQYVQGYSIGKPMPLDATLTWMRDRQSKIDTAPHIAEAIP